MTLSLFYFAQKWVAWHLPHRLSSTQAVCIYCPGSIFPQRPPAKTLQNISSGSKLACSCGQTSQYAQLSRWAWKTFSYLRNWVGGKKIIFSMRTQTAWSPDGDIYEAAWNGPACQKCGRKNALVAQTGSICNWPEHLRHKWSALLWDSYILILILFN